MDPERPALCPAAAAALRDQASRRERQEEYERDYQDSIVTVTNQLRETEGPDMKEKMKTQIRQWFFECRYDRGGTKYQHADIYISLSLLTVSLHSPVSLHIGLMRTNVIHLLNRVPERDRKDFFRAAQNEM